MSLRRLCGLPERPLDTTDQFIIARASHFTLALVVDRVLDVVDSEALAVVRANEIFPGMNSVEAVARSSLGLTILHDLDLMLEQRWSRCLKSRRTKPKVRPHDESAR